MEELNVLLLLVSSVMAASSGKLSLEDRVQFLTNGLLDLQLDLTRLELKFKDDIEILEENIKSHLFERIVPEYMQSEVRSYAAKLLSPHLLDEIIRGHLAPGTIRLRQAFLQVKQQQNLMFQRLRDLTEHNEVLKESLMKQHDELTKKVKSHELVSEERERQLKLLENEIDILRKLVNTQGGGNRSCCERHSEQISNTSVSGKPTGDPETEQIRETKSKILLVPFMDHEKQLKQLDLNSNSLSDLLVLNATYVTAIHYDKGSKRLIIAKYTPHSIISYHNATQKIRSLRKGVGSFGVAVDSERQIVFMTTYAPLRTVSRMTISGNFFRTVAYLQDHKVPRGLTVDPRYQTIYATTYTKIISMNYDGTNRRILGNTFSTLSVDMDFAGNTLFYDDGNRLMKHPLKGKSRTVIGEFSHSIFSLRYYKSTVYVSVEGRIISVKSGRQTSWTLKDPRQLYLICLFPEELMTCRRQKVFI